MNKPFLSIITINYNGVEGLQETMKSVFEQAYIDYEFIVIDGGSSDGSKDVIQKHSDRLSYWVSEKDLGVYSAMNKGIKVSKGTYLLFLNSGDKLSSTDALEDFISNEKFCGDIIYGDYKFEIGEKIFPDVVTPFFFVKSSLPHQSTFFKKSVFDEIGLYNENYKITSDREFYIKCILDGRYVFQHINYPLSIFDLSGISNDLEYKKKKTEENQEVFKKYFGPFYQDYIRFVELEHENNRLKKKNLKGYWRKFIMKLKSI